MNKNHYVHQGWLVSPYSAKTRSYLRFKNIPHKDHAPNAFEMLGKIRKKVGRTIMPTVITPEGEWWQDSSDIIDRFEKRFPEPSIIPNTPKQKIAAYLFEFHADEWLTGPALYYRWSIPENKNFAINEFGKNALPFAPRLIRNKVAEKFASQMQSYLPALGLVGDACQGVEKYTVQLIADLEKHFAKHSFLVGTRPCIGDFALFGPLWAHLFRDPGSTYLFDNAQNVQSWMERMLEPVGEAGEYLANDEVPETLTPVLKSLFAEHFQFALTVAAHVDEYCEKNPDADRVSRAFGTAPFNFGGVNGERRVVTFMYWMLQRPLDAYAEVVPQEKEDVDLWLEGVGGKALMALKLKQRLKRENFKEVLVR